MERVGGIRGPHPKKAAGPGRQRRQRGLLWGLGLWAFLLGGLTGCGELSAKLSTESSTESSAKQSVESTAESSAGQSVEQGQKNREADFDDWMDGMEAENEARRGIQGEEGPGEAHLAGSICLAGSSSMEKYAEALAECFMERHPDVTVTVQFTGSGAGIEAAASGMADIGNSSRYLTDGEKERGMRENIVAVDGIAVCVDPANPVTDLTRQQLADIYTGAVTNWSALGGEDIPVVVLGREAGSGTREAFETFLGLKGQCTYANELDSTGAVMARVYSTPGAIGYVSFDAVSAWIKEDGAGEQSEGDSLRGKVGLLSLEGVRPSVENVEAGTYPLCHPFVMATRGDISAQSSLVQAWFCYVYGDEGRKIAQKMGLAGKEPEEADK